MNDSSHRQAARVFAHLLAGEIRLYNEEAVVLGRRHDDLSERLAEPLRSARERYLARFAEVDPLASYLRTELNTMLAGGRADLIR